MKHQTYSCPSCGSSSTKRCRVAYEQSLNSGPTFDTQRAFGKRAAPPTLAPLWPAAACAGIAMVTVFREPAFAGIALLCGAGLFLNRRRLKPEYDIAVMLYDKLWICGDCAHIFKPE